MAENSTGIAIIDSILVGIHWGKDRLSRMVRSWGSSRGSAGYSQQTSGKCKLKFIFKNVSFVFDLSL